MICFSNPGISPCFNRSLDAWYGKKFFSSRVSSCCHSSSCLDSSAKTSGEFFLICSLSYIYGKKNQLPTSTNQASTHIFLKYNNFPVIHVSIASLASLLCFANFEEVLIHFYHASFAARFAIWKRIYTGQSIKDRNTNVNAYLVRSATFRRASASASLRGIPPTIPSFNTFSRSP